MPQFFCFDGIEWKKVTADNISVADRDNRLYSLAVSEIDPKILSMETIGSEEYSSLGNQNCHAPQPDKKYAIVLGDCKTKFTGLIYQNNDNDPAGYEYMKFSKDGHIILIYLGDPDLLVVSE